MLPSKQDICKHKCDGVSREQCIFSLKAFESKITEGKFTSCCKRAKACYVYNDHSEPNFFSLSHCKHVVKTACSLTIDGIVYIGNQIVIHCQQHLNTSILFSSFFYFQSALSHTLHLPLPREQTALDYTSGLYTPGTMTYFRFSMTRREDVGCLSRY